MKALYSVYVHIYTEIVEKVEHIKGVRDKIDDMHIFFCLFYPKKKSNNSRLNEEKQLMFFHVHTISMYFFLYVCVEC